MLTVEEIQEHMGEICKHFSLQEPDVQKLLKALDPNDDGQIEYNNFIAAAYDKKKLLSDENLYRAFRMLDKTGSGTITKRDLRITMGNTPQGLD